MPRQLDIFEDSRDVTLRNDLAQSLLDDSPAAAQGVAETLRTEFGADPVLAPAAVLIEHLQWRQSLAPPGSLDLAAVLDARRRLDGAVAAAATAVLGAQDAPAWLAGQWCWPAPARAAALLPALADRHLDRLVARFEERFDPAAASGADWAWLPAFALVDQPLLAGPLAPAMPPPETAPGQAFTLVRALLRLERQGRHREIVAHRARLQALSAPLFAAHMASR
jgi:hypothetical protein